jgi:hypothetical protein
MKADQALEFFAASDAKPVASTANEKDGTIDVVWYTGAQVPRKDPDTGDPFTCSRSTWAGRASAG